MPVFELSLTELEAYAGRNPRPDDFDAYWAAALSEMAAVEPNLLLQPHPYPVDFAECFDLYFSGVRGARVHAKYLRPTSKMAPHPCILRFHGYGGNSGDWYDNLAYVAQGFSVAALDCRGQGGSSEDPGRVHGTTFRGHFIRGLDGDPEDLLFRQIYLDTAQLASIVAGFPEVDGSRIGVTGASQGGALTIACAALVPTVKLAAPVYPFLADYQRVWEMDRAEGPYGELREYFRVFDPRHEREREVFTRLGYIDIQHLASRVEADVLMLVGMMDEVCPPSTQFAVFNKILAPKRMVRYLDYGHEPFPDADDMILGFLGRLISG